MKHRQLQRSIESLEPRRLLALTHLYTFDGNANDTSGSAHATLFNGAAISSGRLVLQNAGLFSGSPTLQYAKLPANIVPNSGSLTIEAWYSTFSAVPTWMRVFDFGDQSGVNGNSYLFYTPRGSAGDARATLRAPGSTERTASNTTAANQGYLHMAAVVVDASAGQLILYLDGVLKQSTALNGSTLANINDVNNFLGRSQYSSDAGFSGAIDELRMYDTALAAGDIASHHATGPARPTPATSTRKVENLDRSVVAINRGLGNVYVGWRLLGTDLPTQGFDVYRTTGTGLPVKRNTIPIVDSTNFTDTGVDTRQPNRYSIVNAGEPASAAGPNTFVLGANPSTEQYLSIPVQKPAGGLTRDGVPFHYEIYDASAGDLDGDGKYEFVVKWEPVNDATSSFWGDYLLDAYEMDGARLWRINFGKNLADMVQGYSVFDYDGDGRAEVISQTADGTVDGMGTVIGNPNVDWVNDTEYPVGWIVNGPEYLTVFSGQTGAAIKTINMEPARGNLTDWGDDYGQRSRQVFPVPAYLDGVHPSLVLSRGIYYPRSPYAAQTQQVAYDWDGTNFIKRWHFKAGLNINNNINSNFVGQGNHQVQVADVDGDGKDEIINGSMVVDDNGLPLVSTQLEHGDAMHVTDLDPSRPGLEVFGIHENEGTYDPTRPFGAAMYDPLTGVTIWGAGRGIDVGRGNAADVDPSRPGAENWGGPPMTDPQGAGVIRDVNGNTITNTAGTPLPVPSSNNFFLWWDGDLTRELLDRTYINKWDWTDGSSDRLLTASGVATSQGTKQFPALTGDFLGDWREEVIWKAADSNSLRIYTTVIPTSTRIFTLMHDSQYRQQVALQGNGYNQPPHPSFFIGANMNPAPSPNVLPVVYASQAPASAPGNAQAIVVSPNEINISWTPVSGATAYRLKRSTDLGGTYRTIASNITSLGYFDREVGAGATFYYQVVALNGIEEGPAASISAATPLPAPWVARDIGAVIADGRSSYANGVYQIRAGGAVSGDGLRMLSQDLSGDYDLVTRVDSKTNRIGSAGLMFRKSTAANSAFVSVTADPTDQDRLFLRWRNTDGGTASYAVAYNALPVWLKLTRRGSVFAGYYSVDGTNWTQIGTNRTVTMGTVVPAGLIASGSSTDHTTASFTSTLFTPVTNLAPRALDAAFYRETGPMRLAVTFSEDVLASLDANDFVVTPIGGSSVVPVGFSWDAGISRAWLELPQTLADGRYRLSVASGAVSDSNGATLQQPLDFSFQFVRGDADGDADVDFDDLLLIARNYGYSGRVVSRGNVTQDAAGLVDFDDLLLIAAKYGTSALTRASAKAKRTNLDLLT